MRNIKLMLLLCVFFTLSLTSCQKNEKLIVGKWRVSHVNGDPLLNLSEDRGTTWTFKENGNCYVTLEGYELLGDYDISDNSLIIYVENYCMWDLDIDELNKKEMSLSGKYIDYGSDEKLRVSYDFYKK